MYGFFGAPAENDDGGVRELASLLHDGDRHRGEGARRLLAGQVQPGAIEHHAAVRQAAHFLQKVREMAVIGGETLRRNAVAFDQSGGRRGGLGQRRASDEAREQEQAGGQP